jgi:hypothetical protein
MLKIYIGTGILSGRANEIFFFIQLVLQIHGNKDKTKQKINLKL